jgi:hypothetical protein
MQYYHYQDLFSLARWQQLEQLFQSTYENVCGLPRPESLLLACRLGLGALKTPYDSFRLGSFFALLCHLLFAVSIVLTSPASARMTFVRSVTRGTPTLC